MADSINKTGDIGARCGWVTADPLYLDYHDHEWGVPECWDACQKGRSYHQTNGACPNVGMLARRAAHTIKRMGHIRNRLRNTIGS